MIATYNVALGMLLFAVFVASVVQCNMHMSGAAMPAPLLELSYFNESSGMFEAPMFDLSNQTVLSVLEEHLNQSACDCTSSGYSGVMLHSVSGTITSYGNTTRVGCANHEMDGESSITTDSTYCYVLGGTGCADATPSILGDKEGIMSSTLLLLLEPFTMAAFRECNPLTDKSGNLCIGDFSCLTEIGQIQTIGVVGTIG